MEKTCNKCNEVKDTSLFYVRNNVCKKCTIERNRKWAIDNPDKRKVIETNYAKNNPNKIIESSTKYYQKIKGTPDKRKKARDYHNKKYYSDPFFNIKFRIRSRVNCAFTRKFWMKNTKTSKMLGAEYETVFAYIESKFIEGMSWDNRSEWHIDHIIPLSSATNEEELIKLCHYTNLQPLWAEDNLKKGAKIL